jgi:hypothetical protein
MFQKAMDSERFQKVWELERAGKLEEGLRHLKALANENDPLALIELGSRHITTDGYSPPVLSVGSDPDKGKELIEKGRRALEKMAAEGDGGGCQGCCRLNSSRRLAQPVFGGRAV